MTWTKAGDVKLKPGRMTAAEVVAVAKKNLPAESGPRLDAWAAAVEATADFDRDLRDAKRREAMYRIFEAGELPEREREPGEDG